MKTKDIAIALIDDEPAILDSTRLLLEQQGITVHIYETAEAFLDAAPTGPAGAAAPDCVVTDVRMPGMSGLELQKVMASRHPGMPLILMTGHGDVPMAVSALKAGASDFIEKPFDIEELARSIRSAVGLAREAVVNERSRAEIIERASQLTARQYEVMELVVEGYSSKQIAGRLGISVRTVETYRIWVMDKMGAGSVAALVRMAMQLPPRMKEPPAG